MGVFESITHSEEIEDLMSSAQSMYDSAVERLEEHKRSTSKSLENLGKIKLEAWSGDMNDFLNRFGSFANVQMKCIEDENVDFIDKDLTPNQLMVNMRVASANAGEVMKAGALSIGTGALVGIASYGGVMMFAKASTGTAIAALSGAAKTNATLAWFGGGSLKAGGLGMLGGKVVLAGVVLAPILLVAGTIASAKGKERLAEAKRVHAEAERAVAKMETVITGMQGIERLSDGYIDLLRGLSNKFRPFLREMESISKDYKPGPDGKIDFDQLSEMEQKTLHLSWLLAQLYYHSLTKPILTEDGKVDPDAKKMLSYSEKEYRQLSLDVSNLSTEKEKIKQNLNAARSNFSNVTNKLEAKREYLKNYYENYGRNSIKEWAVNISPFAESIVRFENIEARNMLVSSRFSKDAEESFEHLFTISKISKNICENNFSRVDDITLLDTGICGLRKIEDSQKTIRSDMAVWIQNGFSSDKEFEVADSLSSSDIVNARVLINCITGKENLSTAEYINTEISEVVKRVDDTLAKIDNEQNIIKAKNKYLREIRRILTLYKDEVDEIFRSHPSDNSMVDFDLLSKDEQRVIQMSCYMAELYYHISDSKVFCSKDSINEYPAAEAVDEAKNEIKDFRMTTFKMVGDEQRTGDVFWAPEAKNIYKLNCVFMAMFAVIMIIQLFKGVTIGLLGIVGIVVTLPRFIYFKNLRESQLWFWRLVRLLAGCLIVLSEVIIGMVV